MDIYGMEIRGYLSKDVQVGGFDLLQGIAERMCKHISPNSEFVWWESRLHVVRNGVPGVSTDHKIVKLNDLGAKKP